MKDDFYLIFYINDISCAFNISYVKQVEALPWLTRFPNMPSYCAGIMDWHGEFIQVINPHHWLNYPTKKYTLNDCVIVIQRGTFTIGMIVNEIADIAKLTREESLSSLTNLSTFIWTKEVRRWGENVAMVLDPAEIQKTMLEFKEQVGQKESDLWPLDDKKTMNLFRERSDLLKSELQVRKKEKATPYLLFSLNDEHFGIDPANIKKFYESCSLALLPTSIPSIKGMANLLGNVVPIVDIRKLIHLQKEEMPENWKIIEIDYQGESIGIVVENLEELAYTWISNQCATPVGIKGMHEDFFVGTIMHNDKVITILNVANILKTIKF